MNYIQKYKHMVVELIILISVETILYKEFVLLPRMIVSVENLQELGKNNISS